MASVMNVKTGMPLAEAMEALRLAQEAVALAAENMDRAEKDLDDAYAAMRKASRMVEAAKRAGR